MLEVFSIEKVGKMTGLHGSGGMGGLLTWSASNQLEVVGRRGHELLGAMWLEGFKYALLQQFVGSPASLSVWQMQQQRGPEAPQHCTAARPQHIPDQDTLRCCGVAWVWLCLARYPEEQVPA